MKFDIHDTYKKKEKTTNKNFLD